MGSDGVPSGMAAASASTPRRASLPSSEPPSRSPQLGPCESTSDVGRRDGARAGGFGRAAGAGSGLGTRSSEIRDSGPSSSSSTSTSGSSSGTSDGNGRSLGSSSRVAGPDGALPCGATAETGSGVCWPSQVASTTLSSGREGGGSGTGAPSTASCSATKMSSVVLRLVRAPRLSALGRRGGAATGTPVMTVMPAGTAGAARRDSEGAP